VQLPPMEGRSAGTQLLTQGQIEIAFPWSGPEMARYQTVKITVRGHQVASPLSRTAFIRLALNPSSARHFAVHL